MKHFILTLACISFVSIIGAATYEHLAMVPRWSAAPPLSLSMFQGNYGLNSGQFWMPIHPVTLLLIIVSLVLYRKTPRQKNILAALGIYVFVLLVTFIYFVPELLSIINTPYSTAVAQDLQSRAKTWEALSLVRLGVLIPTAFILLSSLNKPAAKA